LQRVFVSYETAVLQDPNEPERTPHSVADNEKAPDESGDSNPRPSGYEL
jgi:hypothetical protein